jgi:serine acetyltransferase
MYICLVVDIDPGAVISGGLMMDHGTGVVIGETCIIGRNCAFLHGVTLYTSFDRHPKLGNSVFLGCQCTILGNITIGDNCTIGSGSLVLKPLPIGATAVGSPAVIKHIAITPLLLDDQNKGIEGAVSLWAEGDYWFPKIWQDY